MTARVYDTHVLPSPLHARTAACCLTNDWVRDGHYTVVDVYDNRALEYWALHERAGLSDISPLLAYRFDGRDAGLALERLVTSHVSGLGVGGLKPTAWCTDDGAVIGVGVILRLARDGFVLFTRSPSLAWIEDTVAGYACTIEDVTDQKAGLALSGPFAAAVLERAGWTAAARLAPRSSVVIEDRGQKFRVARMTAAGAVDFEIWARADDGPILWDRLMRAGVGIGLRPVGMAAREITRIEGHRPRLNIDYVSALNAVPASAAATPFMLGLGHLVDQAKASFVGRAALRTNPALSPYRLVVVEIDGDEPFVPGQIMLEAKPLGQACSGAFSPLIGAGLAFAWFEDPGPAHHARMRFVRAPKLGQGLAMESLACRLHRAGPARLATPRVPAATGEPATDAQSRPPSAV